jgi:hypothetical protein
MRLGIFLSVLFCAIPAHAASLTYDNLVNLIQQNNLTSIETLLPKLPEDFRSGYTLMKKSQSLQDASYSNPRVIMFGQDASLTCAFNGNSKQRGFHQLECFQFNKDQRSFDFRQITFPNPGSATKVLFSKSGMSTDGVTSCLSCHADDPRPNWDGYSIWSGAYGENDDELEDDQDQYASFVKKRPNDPRYKWLIQGNEPIDPYSSSDISTRPNLRFSDFVNRMNAYRTTRLLQAVVPDWQSLAFALSPLGCELSSDQQDQIKKSGLPFNTDTDPTLIFEKLKIAPNDWSTEINPTANPSPVYDHQGGFGYLAIDTSMAIIDQKANAGDQIFQKGFAQLVSNIPTDKIGSEVGFFQTLFGILPDPDFFGGHYDDQTAYFCPELASLFTREYLNK